LGKRLGRLEISGVKMADQLVNLTDRCGFVAEALVDEHEEREFDKTRILHLESMVAKLEKVVNKMEDEKKGENEGLRKKIVEIEIVQRENEKNFLELVESCQGMEEKVKELERCSESLVEEVKDLQNEKETLVKSLVSPSTSLSSPTSGTQSSSIHSPFTSPPPPKGVVTRKVLPPMFQSLPPPPRMFCPPNFSQHPVFFPHPWYHYQDNTDFPQYPPWTED